MCLKTTKLDQKFNPGENINIDTNKISEAKRIIAQTKNNKLDIGYKFGLEFFYSKSGREFISKLKGKKIFLDLKSLRD